MPRAHADVERRERLAPIPEEHEVAGRPPDGLGPIRDSSAASISSDVGRATAVNTQDVRFPETRIMAMSGEVTRSVTDRLHDQQGQRRRAGSGHDGAVRPGTADANETP